MQSFKLSATVPFFSGMRVGHCFRGLLCATAAIVGCAPPTVRVGLGAESGQAIAQAMTAELDSLEAFGVHFEVVTENPDVTIGTFQASGTRPSPWFENNQWPGWHGVYRSKSGDSRIYVDPDRSRNQASLQHVIAYSLLRWYCQKTTGADPSTNQPGILDTPLNMIETSEGTEYQFMRSSEMTIPEASDLATFARVLARQ